MRGREGMRGRKHGREGTEEKRKRRGRNKGREDGGGGRKELLKNGGEKFFPILYLDRDGASS